MNSEEADSQSEATTALERALGYQFGDRTLLEVALQHASFAHEDPSRESNARLEFLGDAVLGLVVGQLLFEAHPDWQEGDLTRGLHQLVDKQSLATLGRELDLGSHLRLGRTELRSGGRTKASILADATEAVIAAMYLDGGLEPVTDLARRVFAKALVPDAPRATRDPKTRFQEWVMAEYGEFPSYQVIGDTGVEGHESRFTVRLSVRGEEWTRADGRSKRAAEQAAAAWAFERRREMRCRTDRAVAKRACPEDEAGSGGAEGG